MRANQEQKVVSLSYKQMDGSFANFPIGTNIKYIDVLSGRSLEEEFYLGPPTLTTFPTREDGIFEIVQQFADFNTNSETNGPGFDGYTFLTLNTTFEDNKENPEYGDLKIVQILKKNVEKYTENGDFIGLDYIILNKKTIYMYTNNNGDFQISEEYENGDYQWQQDNNGTLQ